MDRFDDVESRILEAPEQPQPLRRPRIHGRWTFVAVAAIVFTGMLTAGASALTEQAEAPVKPKRPALYLNADGVPTMRGGHECHAGEGMGRHHERKSWRSSGPRY